MFKLPLITFLIINIVLLISCGFFLVITRYQNLLINVLYFEMIVLGCFTFFVVSSWIGIAVEGYVYAFLLLTVSAAEITIGLIVALRLFAHTQHLNFNEVMSYRF